MDFVNKSTSFLKIGVLLIVTSYFLYCAITVDRWHFLDGVNLLIHEAGHIVFMPFGEFMSVAGGSILQVLMPLAFVTYFFAKGMLYSGTLVMFWVGQNFINISTYMKDAIEMKLPLLGGGMHDWNFIFTNLNLLSRTHFLGSLFYFIGFAIIIISTIAGFYAISKENKESLEQTRR